ncbi:aminoglycoside phosphotransferase family protein [Paenibacillus sp. sptzw28]|uniref:phosphotransferase n=1 Tax=Paenibacillus sp. sptzw28 TaxID=715179 RepID=UPI001C6F38F6|nr:phosphotransferase [Paenibacillus sp. sptzw28]QYR22532.1 aminoglycoside phosphotransferase family protein [Paenibacillus sp. sptzw28]
MREPKPFWSDVPAPVRREIEALVGSPIRKGTRVFGGYGPSATFRIFLEDGRTVFAKGAGKGSNEVNWRVVPVEESAYRNIDAIRPFSPSYLGSVMADGWHLLLLEDLKDAAAVPPWTDKLAVQAVHDIAQFHLRGMPESGKVDEINVKGFTDNWRTIRYNREESDCFLGLFGEDRTEAEAWLNDSFDILIAAESELMRMDQPWGLIHSDIRSDNLRFRDDKLVLFDWALACRGPLILDVIFFFPSVQGEGGPTAERLLPVYKQAMSDQGVSFPSYAERAAAAATAGFFASRTGKPPIPALPRLRDIQRLQLGPALEWAAKVLSLPKPPPLV